MQVARSHLAPSAGSILFYFSRVSAPMGRFAYLWPGRWSPAGRTSKAVQNAVQQVIKESGTVSEVKLRPAEGGAFVKISADQAQFDELRSLATRGFRTRYLLTTHQARGAEVIGHPWITDMPRSLSRRVSILPELPDEDCYDIMRPYGSITKVKNNTVTFHSIQDAITASFCAHRAKIFVEGQPNEVLVRLRLLPQTSYFAKGQEWFKGHPKATLPLVSLLLLSAIYAVFEPVRELMVQIKINDSFAVVQQYFQWARDSTLRLTSRSSQPKQHDGFSYQSELNERAENLKQYLSEGAPTFFAVIGPEGSGKNTIVESALQRLEKQPAVLEISCDVLKDSDAQLLEHLASNLGYRPTLLWANRVLKVADVALKGITGQTSGITETSDQQIERMLHTTSKVLKRIALHGFNASSVEQLSDSEDAVVSVKSGKRTSRSEQIRWEQLKFLEQHPDNRPVVILSQFNSSEHACELIAQWAAELVKARIARVVCISQDNAFDKSLTAALPNRVFKVVRAEDAKPQVAKHYILNLLQQSDVDSTAAQTKLLQLDNSFLAPLGGRFSDLQAFGRRILSGESPKEALDSLIQAAAMEAMQLFLTENREWTVEQAWRLVGMLAQSPQRTREETEPNGVWLSVHGAVCAQPEFAGFSGPTQQSELEAVLHGMDKAGMLSLRSVGGHITGIKPARPLLRAAFNELVTNPTISLYMKARMAKSHVQTELAKILKAETELSTLMRIKYDGGSSSVSNRIQFVTAQLQAAQKKLEQATAEQLQAQKELSKLQWLLNVDDSNLT